MAGRETLGELALRKQALILESDLNRLTLRAEYQNVRASLKGLGKVNQSGWWWLLAPVAGFFATRLFRRSDSVVNRAVSLLKWLPPLLALWKSFGGTGKSKGPPAP